MDLDGSVYPLTVKNNANNIYPDGDGFEEDEDFNKSKEIGQSQPLIQEAVKDDLDDKIRQDYIKKFRSEVDFHHKVAYRFEKAYRLGKKEQSKKNMLNQEIIDIIIDHSDYIDQDQMVLFYCLYFCVYYNNPDLVEFLRTLITKMSEKREKIN